MNRCAERAAHARHRQDRRQDALGAALLLGADLNASPRRKRGSDPLEALAHSLAGLIEPYMREIDRQEGALRGLIEGAREHDIVVGNPVRLDRVADALPEEVDPACQPLLGEALHASEGALRPRPGDVAAGQPVGRHRPASRSRCPQRPEGLRSP